MAVHVVTGTDEGRVAEASTRLFEKLKPEGGDDFANEIIEGQASNAEDAYQIAVRTVEGLQTVGFFGGGKVVWLRGANFTGSDRTSEAERAKTGVETLLETLKAGLPEGVTFLLSTNALDKRRAFYKWLSKNAELKSYDRIDISKEGWEENVAALAGKEAEKRGLELSGSAMELFVQRAGADSRQISNELEKLDLYLGDQRREVSEGDVRTMVPVSHKGVIWEISRALEKKDAPHTLALIDQQLAKDENAVGLVKAAVIPTVRNLFYAKIAVSDGIPLSNYKKFQAALEQLPPERRDLLPKKKDGKVNAWGLFSSAQKAKRFSLTQLQRNLEACLEADRALVTTSQDHRVVLHQLAVKLCT